MDNYSQIIREDLQTFEAYRSARDEKQTGTIWLNANESPYKTVINNLPLNRYPEKQPTDLILKMSEIFNVSANQIALTRGSDEIIDLLIRLCCKPQEDSVVTLTPTYGMYGVYAQLQGANLIQIPLDQNNGFSLEMNKILSLENEKIKIIFLCSPNNPTGNSLNRNDILALCKAFKNKSLIVVDEAYIDFSDKDSFSNSLNEFENLIILKTFSKAYGLAGIRLGALLANPQLIAWILKIISPYPISCLTQSTALEMLTPKNLQKISEQVDTIKSERKKMFERLSNLKVIDKVFLSDANFILIQSTNANSIMETCSKNGVVIRNLFDKPGLCNCLRISIGLPEENAFLLQLLEGIN